MKIIEKFSTSIPITQLIDLMHKRLGIDSENLEQPPPSLQKMIAEYYPDDIELGELEEDKDTKAFKECIQSLQIGKPEIKYTTAFDISLELMKSQEATILVWLEFAKTKLSLDQIILPLTMDLLEDETIIVSLFNQYGNDVFAYIPQEIEDKFTENLQSRLQEILDSDKTRKDKIEAMAGLIERSTVKYNALISILDNYDQDMITEASISDVVLKKHRKLIHSQCILHARSETA